MRVSVKVGARGGEPAVRARRAQRKAARKRSAAFRGAWRDADERGLDWAVGQELARIAAEDAWDGPAQPKDPYAPQVTVRTVSEYGVRYAALAVAMRTRSGDRLVVEVRKRLGD